MEKNELIKRAIYSGPESFTTKELLGILLEDPCAAEQLYTKFPGSRDLTNRSFSEIKQSTKLTDTRVLKVVAAIEFHKRMLKETVNDLPVIKSSVDMANLFRPYVSNKEAERFAVAYMDRKNQVLEVAVIGIGGITGTVADPRVILKKALLLNAVSLALCHNHPSGGVKPSRADEQLTAKIKSAAGNLDMVVLDHIIYGSDGTYFSFADEGYI